MDNNLEPIKTAFKYRSVQYQSVNAYWLGYCASFAYEGSATIKAKVLGEWGLSAFDFIKRSDTQCFIASTDKFVILSFRGTEVDKYKDILSDADLALTSGYGGKVHKGFKQAYGKVRSQIINKLKSHGAEQKTLWVTGHSLGGALAVLAGYDLKEQGFKVNGVYTIGQPRVGNSTFSSAFDKLLKNKCFRFVDKDDKVPEIPLKEFGYSHVGQAIYIASKYRMALHYRRSKNFINTIVSAGNSLSAHSSEKYVKALEKNIDNNPFTADVQTIKETAIVNIEHEASIAANAVAKEGKKVGKAVESEAKKIGKGVKSLGSKLKKLF